MTDLSLSRAGVQPVRLGSVDLLAEANGALLWPDEQTLAVADLHLEKGSSYAARGVMLPPYDTRATLERLERVASAFGMHRIICLGDSFHDASAPERLADEDARRLARLTERYEWLWVTGNHDPRLPSLLGGRIVGEELRLGSLVFRHQAAAHTEPNEVSGHFHPKASIDVRGRRLSGRCFVHDGKRLVLPAFGAYTGGLDVFEPALRALFPGDFTVQLVMRERVTTLPQARLVGVR